MKKVLLTIGLASSLAFGSATVISGKNQSVSFSSEPEGATILIDGQERGKTPSTLMLAKNQFSTIMIKKEGYVAQTRNLEKKMDPINILNIFWDLSTTDLLTGAAMEYSPNNYHFELREK